MCRNWLAARHPIVVSQPEHLLAAFGHGHRVGRTSHTIARGLAGHCYFEPAQPATSLAGATGWLAQARPVWLGYEFGQSQTLAKNLANLC